MRPRISPSSSSSVAGTGRPKAAAAALVRNLSCAMSCSSGGLPNCATSRRAATALAKLPRYQAKPSVRHQSSVVSRAGPSSGGSQRSRSSSAAQTSSTPTPASAAPISSSIPAKSVACAR